MSRWVKAPLAPEVALGWQAASPEWRALAPEGPCFTVPPKAELKQVITAGSPATTASGQRQGWQHRATQRAAPDAGQAARGRTQKPWAGRCTK